jgi:hypothetical protein
VSADNGANQCLVAAHAKEVIAFIAGSFFMHDSKSKTSDYHDEIRKNNFKT